MFVEKPRKTTAHDTQTHLHDYKKAKYFVKFFLLARRLLNISQDCVTKPVLRHGAAEKTGKAAGVTGLERVFEEDFMKNRLIKLFTWCMALCIALPELALAAGGGKIENVVIVADTRKFTGWEAWWTNLYNESHLYFALLTMALIPVIGVIFGVVADFFMSMIGIDLKSRGNVGH